MTRPLWFPDWSGSLCAVVGAGESVRREDIDLLRGRAKVIVVNRSYELARWVDVLYAADRQFWDVFQGVSGFPGLKVTQDRDVALHFGLHLVRLVECGSTGENAISLEPGVLARGGHSGHQALNLAIQFGARRVMLLGFDFVGDHWHGEHERPLRNPRETSLKKWRDRIDALAPQLSELGVEVFNCSQISRLTAYQKMTVHQALALWSGTSMQPSYFCGEHERLMQPETVNAVPQPA